MIYNTENYVVCFLIKKYSKYSKTQKELVLVLMTTTIDTTVRNCPSSGKNVHTILICFTELEWKIGTQTSEHTHTRDVSFT